MRAGAALLLLAIPLAVWADNYGLVRTEIDGRATYTAQYIKGDVIRGESWTEDSPEHTISIYDRGRRVLYRIDQQKRSYSQIPYQSPDLLLQLAFLIRRPRTSGRVDIFYDITDTGERESVFGSTARHLVLIEKRIAEPGACQVSQVIRRDGWYIPAGAQGQLSYGAFLAAGDCRDTVVRHGEPPRGLVPVREVQGNVLREVLDLSNAPLPDGLFQPPPTYKKVDPYPQVSWTQRFRADWFMFTAAVQSWFD